ncbi:transcriptional regulator ATRX homolog isoform X2 [Centruroides vittatus]|uniref:transcriptional regulator ATRX homolog isoform X2 n=1 Tax=Centruroides vittatus TaxID=120091 RepID=UPI00350FF692
MEMHPVDDDEPNSELIIQDSSIPDSKQSENCLPKKVSDKLSENSVIVLDDGILQKDDEVIYMGSKRGNIPRSRITDKEIENLIVKCTSCGEQINHHNSSYVRRHLHLGVLICRECFEFYDSGEFSQDETGDIYCRWCAQGGKLIACDYCLNAFCYNCIRRNFGRGEVSCIQDAMKWHCYMCNSQKLNGLVSYCSMILDYSQRMSRKRSPKLSNKLNDKVICINDFSDSEKGTWVQQRIEDVTDIAESLKEQVQLLKTNIDKEKPESVIQCNKVLDRILNKYIKQLRNVVGKQSPFIKGRNSVNSHRQVKIETDVQKTESTVSRRITEENGFENSYSDNSNSSESSDEKHSKDDENDDDYSLKSNEFHSDTSGETSEVEENAEKLDDDAKRKSECTELSQNLLTDIHELKSFTSSLNNKTNNSQDLSVYIKKKNRDFQNEDEILTDECSNLNNDAFNVTELISSSENISKINNEFNSENNIEIVKSKNDTDIPEERSEFTKNDDEKDVENISDVSSDKIDRDLSHTSCDENDGIDDHNNADRSILSPQENITNLLLTESNSSIDSEQNVQKEKNDENLSKQEKLKIENEKIKEKLLADDSSDSETEPFSLPEAISLNKDHFNSDSTTEVSTTQSDSDDSNTSEESKSEYSDHKDDKLQMDVKVRIEKVDDRTLDDTIEDLPMDEQKLEKPEKNSEKNKKDKITDNSLDKEIDRLATLSTLTTKRKSLISDDDDDDDKESENVTNLDNGINNDENIDENEISKKNTQKIKSKEIISSDSEFDSDEQLLKKSTDIFEEEKLKLNNVTKSQNEVAKEMLLKDTLSSSNDDSDKSSNGSDNIFKKEENDDDINEHESDEDFKPEEKRNDFDSDDSIDEFLAKKIKRTYHKLLAIPLSEDDSKTSKTSDTGGKRKQVKRKLISSDDEIERKESSTDSDSDVSSEKKSQTRSYNKQMKKRRRIKQMSQSSEDNSDDDVQIISENQEQGDTPVGKGRKNIRKLISDKKLRDETKAAAQAELERKRRILERQKAYNHTVIEVTETGERVTKKLVLEVDEENKEEIIQVHPSLIVKLKPHQVEGVKFMWEGTIESLKQLNSTPGSGCILAHCMGLGKTLQVIVFTHTLLTNEFTKKVIRTCLVICPYNTILNWAQEYETWLDEDELKLSVFELASVKDNYRRASCLEEWKERGGVMIMSYDMFRLLVQENSKRIPKKLKTIFTYTLLDPGPDLVICDEGHILKNESSAVSKATDRIKTRRRVVLTGTPLQNNLSEYHCMVQFVKPHLLGTRKEFLNRFVNPISNGQCADSTPHDVKLMKKRVHILHKLLEGCVQRCDYNSLTSVLPPRHEYVISLKLSDVQVKLYKHFLENLARVRSGTLGTQLFRDCCVLQLICTHPYTLHIDYIRKSNRRYLVDSSDSESGASFIDDRSLSEIEAEAEADEVVCLDDPKPSTSKKQEKSGNSSEDNSGNEDNEKSSKPKNEKKEKREWWSNYIKEEDGTRIDLSGKMVLFFDLLKECELIGDKVLLFSQNLLTLDLIEDLLASITQNRTANSTETVEDVYGSWIHGIDYFRMDGSTNADLRKRWIEIFNDEENTRARLFMISKKAGGLGTNLIGANRVIIMDASWNPSHDIQAIFRVYRFGQKKPVYIYRLLAQGTMEEKIYDRQVTKQSLSCRVVDEQQIERHFNSADLAELYMFNPDSKSKRPTPMVPKDRLLAEMLIKNRDWIVNYHEHDSLLQNISEEDLTEEERQAAWVEYEAEREGIVQNSNTASWNVLDPIIQHQPVPTPDQNPETYGPLPDARVDIAKVVENLKLRRPNMAPNEMNSALLSALVMLRAHYQQCHVIAVRQKQDYMARNETAPVQLNEYLSALNVSIQQLTQVLQTIRAQQSQIHQAQQAAAGIRFRNPPWNQNNRMNHLNRANQTQAYKITLTRGTSSQGQSPALGINQNVLQQGPRGPTTINIQLLSNNRVPVITTTSQRLPVNNAPYASSVLRGHAIRLAGNNILLNNNNNRTTFRFSTPGNTNVPRFNIGNGVTITPISNPHQSQHNHSFPQDSTQEPVITEAEDCENPVPKIRPQSSHTSSVTITELE